MLSNDEITTMPHVLRCSNCGTTENVKIRSIGEWFPALRKFIRQLIPLCDTCFQEVNYNE